MINIEMLVAVGSVAVGLVGMERLASWRLSKRQRAASGEAPDAAATAAGAAGETPRPSSWSFASSVAAWQ